MARDVHERKNGRSLAVVKSLISVRHLICFIKYLCILLFGCQPKFLLCQSLAASGVGAPKWAKGMF